MKIKFITILVFTLFTCAAVSLAVGSGNNENNNGKRPECQTKTDSHDDCDSHLAASDVEHSSHSHNDHDHDDLLGDSETDFFSDLNEEDFGNEASTKKEGAAGHTECGGHDHGDSAAVDLDHEKHETDSCSSGDGHDHAHGVDGTIPVEERAAKSCEHAVPIYQCDQCRYEAGIVKVETGLLKQENGNGLINTQPAAMMNATASLNATGEIALNENATTHISPRISGIIDTVLTDIGMRVKAGDTLFTLNSVELGRALAEYERNRTLSDLAEKVLKRETKLRKERVSSEQDMIDAQMAYEQHRTELLASEQTLHVLGLTEEDLAVMRQTPHGVNSGRLPVRAPLGGTVIEKHAVSGELVEPGNDVILISDISNVWVWANLYSRDLAILLKAQKNAPVKAVVTVPAFPDHQFMGTVDYIGAVMDEDTRTVKVRLSVPNPERLLRPGMFCNVDIGISNGKAAKVVVVPRSAILSDEGKSFVFTHWKDDYYALKDVQAGREFLGMVEIVNGLQEGETVVSEGGFLLKSDVLRAKMGAGCADH